MLLRSLYLGLLGVAGCVIDNGDYRAEAPDLRRTTDGAAALDIA